MLNIFGHPMSTCTRKVLCTLAEKGTPFELTTIDFATGQHKQPAYLEHQPFGQLPSLDHDGFGLYESRAMCRYIDDSFGGPKVIPGDAKQRALVEQWVSVETSNFTPHAMKIIHQLVFGPMFGKTPDMAVVEEGRTALGRTLDIMEKQLAKTPYLAGDDFTFADICYLPYIEYVLAAKQGDLFTSRPHVNAWWELCSDRPSWQKATGKA